MSAAKLKKFSIGVGDRFAHQAKAQLKAVLQAQQAGIAITPVWNKSYREHRIIGSKPAETREAADRAVNDLGWAHSYFVDADHVTLKTVDFFVDSSDFFTLDVADFIGQKAPATEIERFVRKNKKYLGALQVPGLAETLRVEQADLLRIAQKYLLSAREAGKIYRHILSKKGERPFLVEVSMDETEEPQSPLEIFFILSLLAEEHIPLQTIAPKFTGRFNKGIDYQGDLERFQREFEQHIAVMHFAVREFHFPPSLKLSIHSGSDKFSLYPIMRQALHKFEAGLHLKTAGTTWLEEVIGLAQAGGQGLAIAKEIYAKSFKRLNELSQPYANVLEIDASRLPSPEDVAGWKGHQFAAALRHDPANPEYNPHFRQLLHIGYKVAAEMGYRFTQALERYEANIGPLVTQNIFERHILPLFSGKEN